MLDSPCYLQDICIKTLCSSKKYFYQAFKYVEQLQNETDCFIPANITEALLNELSICENLSDEIIQLFTSNLTGIRKIFARNGHSLTIKGLKTFRQHKLFSIDIANLEKVSVNDLISCLSEWSIQNLSVLNVANCSFASNRKFSLIVVLSKLQNLKVLDVSNTELTTHGLEIIVEDLKQLEHLNISETKVCDITPLRKCKHRIRSLSMFNLKHDTMSDFVSVIWSLNNLELLDISEEKSNPLESLTLIKSSAIRLFDAPWCLPKLCYLDISGKNGYSSQDLLCFLQKHPNLQFLGLVYGEMSSEDMFLNPLNPNFNPNLMIAGCASETQIKVALRHHAERKSYVQKLLYAMFNFTQVFAEPRVDLIELVVKVMKVHSKKLAVQISGTACLYNLSKNSLGPKIHPRYFQEIVTVTLNAMANFPKHQQLQKNALLTLCSDRILQDVTFERYRCARLVMESLVAFDDLSMKKMAVAICSILAAKIPTGEIASLGAEPHYMTHLLGILKEQIIDEDDFLDIIMVKFTLSALWNLTDESPKTCNVFLLHDGLSLMIKLLETFVGETSVEAKILGLMNNIVEVEDLRQAVLKNDFVTAIRGLLFSSHIDVGYFSAGIVAHLACDNSSAWEYLDITKSEILQDLSAAVMKWEMPEGEMVSYRSFRPFYPLLDAKHYEIQLWALWAIHHVCSKNSKRYCPMLKEEKGIERISKILRQDDLQEEISKHCTEILNIVQAEIG